MKRHLRLSLELFFGRKFKNMFENQIKLFDNYDGFEKVFKQYSGMDEVNDEASKLFNLASVEGIQGKLIHQVKILQLNLTTMYTHDLVHYAEQLPELSRKLL